MRIALVNPRFGTGVTQRLSGAPPVRDRGDGRLEAFHHAVPDGGTWTPGDICWNTAPDAAGVAAWICVLAGSPGNWKALTAV
jgi:hypothetical protein